MISNYKGNIALVHDWFSGEFKGGAEKVFKEIEKLSLETVIKISGEVIERNKDTINENLKAGMALAEFQKKYSIIDPLLESKDIKKKET